MVLTPVIGRSCAVAGKENNSSISCAAANRHNPKSSAAWTRGGVRERRAEDIGSGCCGHLSLADGVRIQRTVDTLVQLTCAHWSPITIFLHIYPHSSIARVVRSPTSDHEDE